MKYLKNILLFTICISLVSCSKEKTKIWYKGNVKSIMEKEFSGIWKFGEFQKNGTKNTTVTLFNDKGDITEKNQFSSDEKMIEKSTNKFDGKGNQIESNQFNSDGSLKVKYTSKYNDKNNLIETITYNSDGSMKTRFTCKYDNKNQEKESSTYNSNGSLDSKMISEYDIDNNKTKDNFYISDGSLQETYLYNVIGNIVESNFYMPDGLAMKEFRNFDKKNNLIEINSFYSKGKQNEKRTYSYDGKGILLEMIVYYYNAYLNRNSKEITKNDSNGDLVEYSTYDQNGTEKEKTTYKYTYDQVGNWITKSVLENGIQTSYVEREIKYY